MKLSKAITSMAKSPPNKKTNPFKGKDKIAYNMGEKMEPMSDKKKELAKGKKALASKTKKKGK